MKILDRIVSPAGITLIYMVSGVLWITFSDQWLERTIQDFTTLSRMQSYKGWFYIALTAFGLFYLLRRHEFRQGQIRANYLNVFRETKEPMWIFSEEPRHMLLVNPAALALFEYGLADFLALTDSRFFPESGLRRIPARSGKVLVLQVLTSSLEFDGKPCRLAAARDITAEMAARETIDRLNRELEDKVQERTRELTILNKELEASSYSVSHDLQAPLRAINGFSRELLDHHAATLSPDARHYLRRILNAAERMERLITDILSLSRISRIEPNPIDIDLKELVSAVAAELKEQAGAEVEIRVELDGTRIRSDPGMLRIVFQNLLSNAIKFSAKTDKPVVEVGAKTLGSMRIFYVKDNGAGFDMGYYDKLFKPFQRLHAETDYTGSGIGLATVNRIMRRLKGMVWAESKPGEGTVFYLTFPARL